MQGRSACTLAMVALMGLAGCHRPGFLGGKPKPPTGQVVATVGNQEITTRELEAELSGVNITDPKQMKLAEQRALQVIIMRKLLANAARAQGLDKTPDFALQRDRAIDTVLAEDLEAKVAKAMPTVAPEEVQAFISNNPDIFAQRKIFSVDQITFVRPNDPGVLKALQPLNTMPAIADYLTSQHINFKRGQGTIDVVGMDPRLVDQILKLPAGAVFVVPNGPYVIANQITSTQVQPLTGDQAQKYATQVLKAEQTQQAVQRELGSVIQQGMKTVQYNPAYRPPAPPKNAAPAQGANAAVAPVSNAVAAK